MIFKKLIKNGKTPAFINVVKLSPQNILQIQFFPHYYANSNKTRSLTAMFKDWCQ